MRLTEVQPRAREKWWRWTSKPDVSTARWWLLGTFAGPLLSGGLFLLPLPEVPPLEEVGRGSRPPRGNKIWSGSAPPGESLPLAKSCRRAGPCFVSGGVGAGVPGTKVLSEN